MADIMKLLEEIKALNIKQEAIEKATGGHFNIFEITNMAHKEVHICQVIKELIDPKGSHCQGDIYLRLFVEHVLKLKDKFSNELYSKTVVTAEHLIDENRRIDIYIKAGNKFAIPIEAKIWAGDQYKQCHDYYEYAKAAGSENVALYYLTCDGHMPSSESTKGMSSEEINNINLITFKEEIICWLEECLKIPDTIRLPSIREIIMQLTDALRRLTGQGNNEIEMEIRKMIESKDIFKSADQLANVVLELKEELVDKIFFALDYKIKEKYGLKRVMNQHDIERVAAKSKNSRGICYDLGNIPGTDYSLALRITKGNYIYASYCLLEEGEIFWGGFSKVVSQEDIVNEPMYYDKDCIAWDYLIQEENLRPNLYAHNEAYYELVEEGCFTSIVESMFDDLDKFLNTLKPEFRI